jgi:hypothetical protein
MAVPISTAKTLCLSYYCLFLLFDGPGERHRIGSTWKRRGKEGNRGGGMQWGEMTDTIYAHVNK